MKETSHTCQLRNALKDIIAMNALKDIIAISSELLEARVVGYGQVDLSGKGKETNISL